MNIISWPGATPLITGIPQGPFSSWPALSSSLPTETSIAQSSYFGLENKKEQIPPPKPSDYLAPIVVNAALMQVGFPAGEFIGQMVSQAMTDSAAMVADPSYPSPLSILAMSAITNTMEYGLIKGFLPPRLRQIIRERQGLQAVDGVLQKLENSSALFSGGIDRWTAHIRERWSKPFVLGQSLKEKMAGSSLRMIRGLSEAVPASMGDVLGLPVFAGATASFFGLYSVFCDPAADGSLFKAMIAAMIFAPPTYGIIFKKIDSVFLKSLATASATLTLNISLGFVGSDLVPADLKSLADLTVRLMLLLGVATFLSGKTKVSPS